jgi:NAD(P)-dependent dehydrogenase (short-subunit alcohol dehydrogenase family)
LDQSKANQEANPVTMEFGKLYIKEKEMPEITRTVIITGGAGSIGQAAAKIFAENGDTVVLCDNRSDELLAAAEKINKNGGRAIPIQTDIRNIREIEEAVNKAKNDFGRIDVLINTAGGSSRGENAPIHIMKEETVIGNLEVNLFGTLFFCRAVAEIMINQREGKIINIASIVGMYGKVNHCNYSAAKAGIIGLTKTLAMELGPCNINVNCVSPGLVPRDRMNDEKIKKTTYLNRVCQPKDVAELIFFLASEKAAFITGENIVIDGGRSLGLKGD